MKISVFNLLVFAEKEVDFRKNNVALYSVLGNEATYQISRQSDYKQRFWFLTSLVLRKRRLNSEKIPLRYIQYWVPSLHAKFQSIRTINKNVGF